jgi:hypothetical protein
MLLFKNVVKRICVMVNDITGIEIDLEWAMDALKQIADITRDSKSGIGAKVHRLAEHTHTHVIIAQAARRAGGERKS